MAQSVAMFKSIKVAEKEYREIRLLAKKQGKLLHRILTEAIRYYINEVKHGRL